MKKSKILKAYLILSGLLLTFIGGSTLLMPVQMKTTAGMDLAGNTNVLNDVRATSALLLVFAILTLFGAFVDKLLYTANLVVVLLFLSLGLGRVISIVLDGVPAEGLVSATGLELVLGTLGAILFVRANRQ